jgi:nucleotide-binding universal stress UspA family protein
MPSAPTPLGAIVHPTDFAASGAAAFAHALKIALIAKSQLCLLNVRGESEAAPARSGFRHVRDVLVNWGMLDPDAQPDCFERELGLRVSSLSVPARNARTGILDFLDSHPCDLVVLATHENKRTARWFDVSAQRGVLRKGRTASLFLREAEKGFVDARTGALSLQTILVPIDDRAASIPALRRIEARVRLISPGARIQLLHVGERAPEMIDAQGEPLDLPVIARQGAVVETILKTAAELNADMIAMPTAGRHGLLAAVRGSTTARVLDDARWPLVAVPME